MPVTRLVAPGPEVDYTDPHLAGNPWRILPQHAQLPVRAARARVLSWLNDKGRRKREDGPAGIAEHDLHIFFFEALDQGLGNRHFHKTPPEIL